LPPAPAPAWRAARCWDFSLIDEIGRSIFKRAIALRLPDAPTGVYQVETRAVVWELRVSGQDLLQTAGADYEKQTCQSP
jgi:hypothetical protein